MAALSKPMKPPNRYTAQQIALRMLNIRSYTETEIRQRLRLRSFASNDIENAISYLHEHSYLNDSAICHNLFQTYCKSKKYSLKIIIMKLKQRGISEDIINELICGYDLSFEIEVGHRVVEKRFKDIESDDIKRIAKYLARKGFSYVTIAKIINNLERNTPGRL